MYNNRNPLQDMMLSVVWFFGALAAVPVLFVVLVLVLSLFGVEVPQ